MAHTVKHRRGIGGEKKRMEWETRKRHVTAEHRLAQNPAG
jgi:hypothetical protein